MRKILAISIIAVLAAFAAGINTGRILSSRSDTGSRVEFISIPGMSCPEDDAFKGVDFKLYWEVRRLIKEKHVNPDVKDADLFYGSVNGLVEGIGDQHSHFLPPDVAKMQKADMAGNFAGIGAQVGPNKDKRLSIVAPLDGQPAAKAGLMAGDLILEIDGAKTDDMNLIDAVNRIRGEKGKPVKLLIFREGWKEPREFVIVRDSVEVKSVRWTKRPENGKRLAVVTIVGFHEDTIKLFFQAAAEMRAWGAQGVIVDLRNDPGGALQAAVEVAGAWVPGVPIVRLVQRGGRTEEYAPHSPPLLMGIPTVVLVNGGSASASEILAGALQDYQQAVIIGEKTYGKGSGQLVFDFKDGSRLLLTNFLWYTPSGRSINKDGISPDQKVELKPADAEKKKDPQMDAAIRHLLGK